MNIMLRRRLESVRQDGAAGGGPPVVTPPAAPAQVQLHQGNPQIPGPADALFQQARASGVTLPGMPPPAAPKPSAGALPDIPSAVPTQQAVDFWGAMSSDGDISNLPPPAPPPSAQWPQAAPPVPGQTPPAQVAPQPAATPQQQFQPFPQAQPAVAPTAPPAVLPTAQDPFDINALLAGVQLPTPAPVEPQPQQAVQPQLPVVPQQPGVQPQATPPALSPEQMQQEAINALMPRYQLSADDDRGMISEPGRVIPKLAAQLHLSIARDLAGVIGQMIPEMVRQHADRAIAGTRAQMEFFSQYPQLNRPEFKPYVAQALSLVRQMNPQATREEVVKRGALLAATEIRSRFSQRPQQPQAPVAPYVPPNGGGSAPVNGSPPAVDIWSQLGDGDMYPW